MHRDTACWSTTLAKSNCDAKYTAAITKCTAQVTTEVKQTSPSTAEPVQCRRWGPLKAFTISEFVFFPWHTQAMKWVANTMQRGPQNLGQLLSSWHQSHECIVIVVGNTSIIWESVFSCASAQPFSAEAWEGAEVCIKFCANMRNCDEDTKDGYASISRIKNQLRAQVSECSRGFLAYSSFNELPLLSAWCFSKSAARILWHDQHWLHQQALEPQQSCHRQCSVLHFSPTKFHAHSLLFALHVI